MSQSIYKVHFVLTESERVAAFERSLATLPSYERDCIEELVDILIDAVKAERPYAQFSRAMALELLGCLGMWLVE
jgi:hypothetical protein